MKKGITAALLGFSLLTTGTLLAQNPAKKSPPATATETLANGTTVTIKYHQPSLRGRTIGKDVEPMTGKVWRMGANNATTIELNRDSKIEGKNLSEGRYSLFGLLNEDGSYTLIFNRATEIWGTMYDQNKDKDALRVTVTPGKSETPTEMLTYTIDKNGTVSLLWGNMVTKFRIE